VRPINVTDGQLPETQVGLVLRWAVVEHGTAGLADMIGPSVVIREPPDRFMPQEAVVCGQVLLLRRERAAASGRLSSYEVVRRAVSPGIVVLIHADPTVGAAFGSGIALLAADRGAAAMITDGTWRDAGRLRTLAMPVGANGADPTRPAGCPVAPTDDETIFGAKWSSGDWLLRDADGMVRLNPEAALRAATAIAAEPTGDLISLLGQP
jgi:regulator of RNase E activity RraA